ncbi:hypothetical protein NE235_33485 [Actinoallomurus spadix]|uniref:WxL domain-containing protein n=1 Tax=Actinoallomurus spadix TaxID=79912 RepID=A0ABN0X820_9ACTN|nr:hypothetical protein [Actinoallomurus spadix]MCO5991036.1 hypothetical protein [Actinoallomurus spadix]
MSGIRRLSIALAGGAALTAALLIAPPAPRGWAGTCPASTTCPTTVTFSVTAPGTLTINVPGGPVNLGGNAPGNQVTGQLGAVTVADQRAALAATWTATVSATNFTTGGNDPAEIVPASDVAYWSGPATATTGTGTFVPGQADAAAAVTLDQSRTAFSKTTGSGDNSATWNPTLVITIPAQAVAGTYTGTVNHQVA